MAITIESVVKHPPAAIVAKILEEQDLGYDPEIGGVVSGTAGNSSDWPIFCAGIPDNPDNIIVIYDTVGTKEGRFMESGMVQDRPGIQIQVRCDSYEIGWEKIRTIQNVLDQNVRNETVTIGTINYFIWALSRTSPPIPLGKSIEDSKRYIFSLNYTGTFSVA